MKLPLKIAAGVALSGLLATAGLFALARHTLTGAFRAQFAADVSTRTRIIEEKLEEAVLIARAASGIAETARMFDPQTFSSFADHFLDAQSGLTALSLVAAVPAAERALFETQAREFTGRTDFTLYEGAPGEAPRPLGSRGIYYPVLLTRTRDASALVILGYDLGSSPSRLAALERARDTGEAIVTERIRLAGAEGRPGFIVFFPVYDADRPHAGPSQRRAALRGFVQAVFSLDDLIEAALGTTKPVGLPFELLDLSAAPGQRSIYRWPGRLPPAEAWNARFMPSGVHLAQEFRFAGRTWGIDVTPNAAYLAAHYPVAHLGVLPAGLLLTCMLAAYLYIVLSRREELAAHNAALESEIGKRRRAEEALRASEEKYRIVADNAAEWEYWLDPEGRFIYSSPSSVRVTGFDNSQFLEDPSLLGRLIVAEDAEGFAQHRHEVTGVAAVGRLMFRIRHRDGGIRWIDHLCQSVFDETGRFLGTRGSNRDVTEAKRVEEERERLIAELRQAQENIKTLEGILPICASCKKIRDESGGWVQVETYVSRHTSAEFSHGICPECLKTLYPEYAQRERRPPA